MTLEDLVANLSGVRGSGTKGYSARCPAHDDKSPSLSLRYGNTGGIILHCHAGCSHEAVLAALGITDRDLAPPVRVEETDVWTPRGPAVAVYNYTDEHGRTLFEVCRTADKQFPQRVPDPLAPSGYRWKLGDVRRVLYHVPNLMEGIGMGRTVYVVEGEKDVEALERVGCTATCNPGGAGKWRGEYSETLRGADVTIIADRDETGRRHAAEVARALKGVADRVRICEAAEGKDVSDHLAAGHGVDELVSGSAPAEAPATNASGGPVWYRIEDLLLRPELLEPPTTVVPRLGWVGRLTLLSGKEKTGKSSLIGQAVAAVANAEPFLGEPTMQAISLWLAMDEPLGDLIRRLDRFGARHRVAVCQEPFGLEHLAKLLVDTGATFLIIDTLGEFFLSLIEDPHDAKDWIAPLRELRAVLLQYAVACVLIHHTIRDGTRYADSRQIGAGVDTVITMLEVTDDPQRRILDCRSRIIGYERVGLRYIDDAYHLDGGGLPLSLQVFDAITHHPGISRNELRSELGCRGTVLDIALRDLVQTGRVENRGGNGNGVSHAYFVAGMLV